jgi:hypothetical protein
MAEPVLRKGSTDPAVRDLQQALKALGHDPGPIDGVFGDATESGHDLKPSHRRALVSQLEFFRRSRIDRDRA